MTTPRGTTKWLVNRGTDFVFSFVWRDTDGDPQSLAGWTLTAMDVSSAIASFLTITIIDAGAGTVRVRIEWDDTLQSGSPYYFRIQATAGAEDVSTNLQEVTYQ